MSYNPGAIEAALAAAVGDDGALIAELRAAFVEGVARALAAMTAAADADGWCGAATRLKGLAASFGAIRLMTLADAAATGAPGDKAILAKLRRAAERI